MTVFPKTESVRYPKVALVTGAARRIGRAIALDFAAMGWSVAVHYRTSAQAAKEVVAEIEAQGNEAVALEADLANEAETGTLVARATAALGPVGCLVNNASVFEVDDALSATRTSWDRHMEPNLRAPFVLSQAFAAQLPTEAEGLIVNIIDQRVWALRADYMSYALAKSGLWTLTRTLALGLAPRIRVVGIGPGYTLPEVDKSSEAFEANARLLPLGRPSSPAEVCLTVRYLLAATSVTGQMIALDGGQHLVHSEPSKGR